MCGIVGAIAQREVAPILLEGLRRLEYRGYDSAGMAVLDSDGELKRLRTTGKVAELARAVDQRPLHGLAGVAHTRWATHGEPTDANRQRIDRVGMLPEQALKRVVWRGCVDHGKARAHLLLPAVGARQQGTHGRGGLAPDLDDLRLHMACGGALAVLQHVLRDDAYP